MEGVNMGNFQKEYGESELLDTYLNQSIAETLKELRTSYNWSYTDLANKLNNIVSRQTLNNYELGKTKLRMNMFFEFAKVYHLKPNELYEKINMKYITKLSHYTEKIVNKK